MGDNRHESLDPRLIGKVSFVLMARVAASVRFIIRDPTRRQIGIRVD